MTREPQAFKLAVVDDSGTGTPMLVVDGRAAPLAELAARFGEPLPTGLPALMAAWEDASPGLQRLADRLGADEDGALAGARPVESLTLRRPVEPRQIFCAGANYRQHVIDLVVESGAFRDKGMTEEAQRAQAAKMMDDRARNGRPFVFQGLHSALAAPGAPLVLPHDVAEPDWELELGVVIGRGGRRIPRDRALEHVAGYTVVNDVTARDKVSRKDAGPLGMDWLASKNAPGFLPVGPYLTPAAFVGDPQTLQVVLRLNGQTMQDESTADMIFDVAQLIEFISAHVELLPGDLLCTGSPAGNGTHYGRFLREGDVMEGEIDGLGVLRTACVAEAPAEPAHAA